MENFDNWKINLRVFVWFKNTNNILIDTSAAEGDSGKVSKQVAPILGMIRHLQKSWVTLIELFLHILIFDVLTCEYKYEKVFSLSLTGAELWFYKYITLWKFIKMFSA
jgi:hypothetical protein